MPPAPQRSCGAVATAIRNAGFTVIEESLNAVDAWLGSLPGHCHANVRLHPVSSLNLVHMIPLSAVWAGPARNEHLEGPPLIVAKSNGTTPFRLVTHVGDVGHMLVVGPTGAGNRSCWLSWRCSSGAIRKAR